MKRQDQRRALVCKPAALPAGGRPARHRRRWTAREDRVLRASVGIVPAADLAARLGRSVPAVRARARLLGLGWYRARPGQQHLGYTLSDVARLLGANGWTVRRWIAAGWLVADRREVRLGRHPLWLIFPDDLERFLRECRPVYEPWRIRDPAWRAFVTALPPERDPWLAPGEAAPLLHLTAHGVRKLITTGRLEARRWGGRYYIRRSALARIKPPVDPGRKHGKPSACRPVECEGPVAIRDRCSPLKKKWRLAATADDDGSWSVTDQVSAHHRGDPRLKVEVGGSA